MANLLSQPLVASGSVLHVLRRASRTNRSGTETYPATLHVWLWSEGFEPAKVKVPDEFWGVFDGVEPGAHVEIEADSSRYEGTEYYRMTGLLNGPTKPK